MEREDGRMKIERADAIMARILEGIARLQGRDLILYGDVLEEAEGIIWSVVNDMEQNERAD